MQSKIYGTSVLVLATVGSMTVNGFVGTETKHIPRVTNAVTAGRLPKPMGRTVPSQRLSGTEGRAADLQAFARPLAFEENQGQAGNEARYTTRGRGYQLHLNGTGAAIVLHDTAGRTAAFRLAIGTNAEAPLLAEGLLGGVAHYYIGSDPDNWRTGIPMYQRIRQQDAYPSIDLLYYGTDGMLEYDVIVKPGGRPEQIRILVDSDQEPQFDSKGDIAVPTKLGKVHFKRPVAYQEQADGSRRRVSADYQRLSNRSFGFRIGSFDRTRPLIIDPVLSYSTYAGGTGSEFGNGIAVASDGSIYITGETGSTNYPTLSPFQTDSDGLFSDAFVTKLNSNGQVIYSTYIGGNSHDKGLAVAVDAAGQAYVTGQALTAFPVTPGAMDTTFNGGSDVFLSVLSPSGSLLYSSYLGGTGAESGLAIAVDTSGFVYIAGEVFNPGFPVSGGVSSTFGGGKDAFLTKISLSTGIVYSTYFGGSGVDVAYGVAVDSSGNAYITGETISSNFPTSIGAFRTTQAGGSDAFISKINTTATGLASLVYSTYLGGSANENTVGGGIAIDNAGNAYVTGSTTSTNFPTVNAFQPSVPAGDVTRNVFITKLNPGGSTLVYSTFLSGSSDEDGLAIAVDPAGSVHVAGKTFSPNFPTANPIQASNRGNGDAFITKLSPSGSSLVYSTFLGGTANDEARGIALDSVGNTYVTGLTGSTAFPTAGGPFQPALAGSTDAFVAKISDFADLAIAKAANPNPVIAGQNLTYSITVTNYGPSGATGVSVSDPLPPATVFISAASSQGSCFLNDGTVDCSVGALAVNGTATVTLVVTTTTAGTLSNVATVAANQSDPTPANNTATASTVVSPSNQNPSLTVSAGSVIVLEGSTTANAGTYTDPNTGDNVTLSSSVGVVTKNGTNTGTWAWSLTTSDGPLQSQSVTITANDGQGGVATITFTLTVNNVPPSVTLALSANPVMENSTVTLSGTIADPGISDTHTVVIDWGDGSSPTGIALAAGVLTFSAAHLYADDRPSGTASDAYPITAAVTDKDGGAGTATLPLTVRNIAPSITAVTGSAAPLALGTAATVAVTFTDAGPLDTHTCQFAWDDGSPNTSTSAGSGACSASRTYAAAGVYTVRVTVTDDDTGSAEEMFQFVVVYDPTAGFVTGGGWIDSAPGAYQPNPSLAGKANFGFVSRYARGTNVPTGQTHFEFHVANFSFEATEYEWLVVSGARAQYKGSGTVNDTGTYNFLLTVRDGQAPGGGGTDQFRIKIWNSGGVIYDNVLGASDDMDQANPQNIGGGSIQIKAN
jgi:uncharacterized repeat protein (TIGR01451 family)